MDECDLVISRKVNILPAIFLFSLQTKKITVNLIKGKKWDSFHIRTFIRLLQYRVKIETYLIAVQHARSIGRDRGLGWGGMGGREPKKLIQYSITLLEGGERMNFTLQRNDRIKKKWRKQNSGALCVWWLKMGGGKD